MVIFTLLFLITIIVCLSQTIAFRRLYRYVDAELSLAPPAFKPRAAVILPCKGLDPGFRENVIKLLDQDYANFEVIFALASETDPAYPVLAEVCRENSHIPCRLVIAGINGQRAQKINNQLAALAAVSAETEIFVFVDSDVIARQDFLRYLIAPLCDSTVGVTTGYRFYIASLHNIPSLLRSLWNRMSAWEMASARHAFAWGGAMAIRKSVFEKARVAERWDRAADDDLSLTCAVKALGLSVHFVPQCLVASEGDASVGEIIEWTNRQLILTKVYYPELWLRAIARASIMAVWLLCLVSALWLWLWAGDNLAPFALLTGLIVLPIELLFLARARGLWRRVLCDRPDYLRESFLSCCLSLPLAHLVLPWMTLFSALTNRIQWRGITYELKSPVETLIIG